MVGSLCPPYTQLDSVGLSQGWCVVLRMALMWYLHFAKPRVLLGPHLTPCVLNRWGCPPVLRLHSRGVRFPKETAIMMGRRDACFLLETHVKGDSCFAIPPGKRAQDRRNLWVFQLYPFYGTLHVLHHRMYDLKLRVLPNLSPPGWCLPAKGLECVFPDLSICALTDILVVITYRANGFVLQLLFSHNK